MPGCRGVLIGVCLYALAAPALAQDAPIREIVVVGAKELSADTIRREITSRIPDLTTATAERISAVVEEHYHKDGYTFAHVTVDMTAASGRITVNVEEGVIDAVEFQGVEDKGVAARFVDEFALRAGDVFNRKVAMQALEILLRPTRGAIRPGRVYFQDTQDLRGRRGTFDLIDRNGQRVLLVGLQEPAGRFRLTPDLGDREDWFTPVDGFVPSLGMGVAVFDHHDFNHSYVHGHLSFKTAPDRVGYALGFERPVFRDRKLFAGGELHDLTASDDQWQVSGSEASLAAFGPRKSFRDYYRRHGVQVHTAYRVHPRAELFFLWRGERQESLRVESDFSLWNDDEPFRPNRLAENGYLSALVVGASLDGDYFDRESLGATYRRHLQEEPFGERLDFSDRRRSDRAAWRIDWSSEITTPGLQSDFDFTRNIVSGRARYALTRHQDVGARVIGGWARGLLPPQRQFAIGGLGTVHGYEFKEQIGNKLALVNLEYGLGWRNAFQIVGFYDAGRVDAKWLNGVGFGFAIAGARIDFGYKVNDVPGSLKVTLRLGRTF